MNYIEHREKLDELYRIAVDMKDISAALLVVDRMIIGGAAAAAKAAETIKNDKNKKE